jgi:tetratricopeptide (TPR) repeat protein
MALYYSGMVSAIELSKEDARLSTVTFLKEAPPSHLVKAATPPPPAPTGAAKTLDDAEKLYRNKDFEKAKQLFLDALGQTDVTHMHATAYFGLARIAAMQKDPETSERLFQKTLELEPDSFVKGWTLVYLGRLAVAADDREAAQKYFQSALEVKGASAEAIKAAKDGAQNIAK